MPSLGQWFVELATTGRDKVDADIDAVGKKIAKANQQYGAKRSTIDLSTLAPSPSATLGAAKSAGGGLAGMLGGEAAGGMMKMLGPIAAAAGPAAIALVAVGAAAKLAKMGFDAIVGLIQRGLAGSNQMQRFDDAMQRLADLVASSVLPVLHLFTDMVNKVASNPQFIQAMMQLQTAVGKLAEAFGPTLMVAIALSISALERFAEAVNFAATAANPGALGGRLGAWLGGGGSAAPARGFEQVSRGGGNFESVTEAYRRFSAASVRQAAADPQLQAARDSNNLLTQIRDIVGRLRPAFGS